MVSRLARADIEKMRKQGIDLTVDETVKLNALGCAVECVDDGTEIYTMPRCAFLDELCFREATIGHELWLHGVGRWLDIDEDINTMILVRAFALSRNQDQLPDPLDKAEVQKQMDCFFKTSLSGYTPRQVVACLNYVTVGADPNSGEDFNAHEPKDEDANAMEKLSDGNHSIAIGIMNRGIAMRLGLTLDEYMGMTPSHVQTIIAEVLDRELGEARTKSRKADALGDYVSALNAIRAEHRQVADEGKNENEDANING